MLCYNILQQRLDAFSVDKVAHLHNRRRNEIVAHRIGPKGVKDGSEQVVVNNVAVVELIITGENGTQEAAKGRNKAWSADSQ